MRSRKRIRERSAPPLLAVSVATRVRTLSATKEVAALLTSRRWFTEVSHEAHKHVDNT